MPDQITGYKYSSPGTALTLPSVLRMPNPFPSCALGTGFVPESLAFLES